MESKIRYLHIFSLSAIGITHPLQEQLAENPEFFVVKNTQPIDIVLLVLFLSLLLPVALSLLILAAGWIHPRIKNIVYYAVLSLLLLIMSSAALNRVWQLTTFPHILVSSIAAALVLYGYSRFHSIRSTFPYLAIAIVLVPGVFLANASVRKFLFPPKQINSLPSVSANIPIVVVLWDELPLAALLNSRGRIDERLYPNLAAFADSANWYPNATTVSPWTDTSVSALLTGTYPKKETLASFYDHPRNLFTMLKGTYTFKVFERETRLCPPEMCNEQWVRPGAFHTMKSILTDGSAVLLHIILPQDLGESLPEISKHWADFWPKQDNRSSEFQKFLDSIEPSKKSVLYFLHSGFPHSAWKQLPSRQTQELITQAIQPSRFSGTEKENIRDYRAHLLQIAHSDELFGRLVQKLRVTGLYDRALIVTTSDHGISMTLKKIERNVTTKNYPEVMLIPLILKLPQQKEGKILLRNVETIDLLPTIADVLNAQIPWADGVSMLDESKPERAHKLVYSSGKEMKVEPHLVLKNTLKNQFLP